MTMTNDPHGADSDRKAAPRRPSSGLMSFKAFLRLNGGFGVKAGERNTD